MCFLFFHPVAKVRRKRSIFYVLGSHLTLSLSPPFLGFHNPPIKLTKCLPFFSCLFFALSIESIGESLFRLLLLLPLLHFPRNEGKGERGEKIALTSILLLLPLNNGTTANQGEENRRKKHVGHQKRFLQKSIDIVYPAWEECVHFFSFFHYL